MQMNVPFGVYKKALRASSNEPVRMNRLLEPFGFISPDKGVDEDLYVGLVLDHLAERFYDFECIDPMDVAEAAWELGFQPARIFLDEGPLLISQQILREQANLNF